MEVSPGPLPDGRRSGGDEGLGSRLHGHQTMTAQSAAETASPAKTSRANVIFRGLARWPPLFFPYKMAEKKSPIIVTLPLKKGQCSQHWSHGAKGKVAEHQLLISRHLTSSKQPSMIEIRTLIAGVCEHCRSCILKLCMKVEKEKRRKRKLRKSGGR